MTARPGNSARSGRLRGAIAALALSTLAGCVGGAQIYNLNIYRSDPNSHLFAAGSDTRGIATYVSGNPFGMAPENLADVTAASIESAFPNRKVRFAVRRSEPVRDDVAMVVAYDPPPGLAATWLCRRPGALPTRPRSDAVTVLMAFCTADRPLVSIEGRIARSGLGFADQDFVVLLRDMARRMFEAGPKKTA